MATFIITVKSKIFERPLTVQNNNNDNDDNNNNRFLYSAIF